MADNRGYEVDKLLVDPVEYWAYRIENGRRTLKWGPFFTEHAARLAVELDINDKPSDQGSAAPLADDSQPQFFGEPA